MTTWTGRNARKQMKNRIKKVDLKNQLDECEKTIERTEKLQQNLRSFLPSVTVCFIYFSNTSRSSTFSQCFPIHAICESIIERFTSSFGWRREAINTKHDSPQVWLGETKYDDLWVYDV